MSNLEAPGRGSRLYKTQLLAVMVERRSQAALSGSSLESRVVFSYFVLPE
jgi:hypothetical protein